VRLGFAAVGLAGGVLARGPQTVPLAGAAALTHLTAVVRLPPSLALPLEAEARALADEGAGHVPYTLGTLHVAILSVDRVLGAPGQVAAVARRHRRFALDLRGLVLGPSSVLVRAFPRDEALFDLRRELAGLLAPGRDDQARRLVARRLAHATLLRLGAPAS